MSTTNKPINVLVSAVGSELAFSVIKALKASRLPLRLIGTDIFDDVVGKYWCDEFLKVPMAKERADYVEHLNKIIDDHQIQVVIPTSDAELPLISELQGELRNERGVYALCQPLEEFNRFNDKWLAYQWFDEHAIGTPHTYLPKNVGGKELTFPLIVKPRTGGGSRHIYKVEDNNELQKALKIVPQPIIQVIVLPDTEEYTAGVFKSSTGEVHAIIMRRELKFGMTNKAWVVERNDLKDFCIDSITKTNLIGSSNIQFRVDKEGPKILEINPRFSGTTGIRAHFGFNDVEMWIQDSLGLPVTKPEIKKGSVLRFMEEIYIND